MGPGAVARRSAWWIVVGAVSGGVVLGALATVLFLADTALARELGMWDSIGGVGYAVVAAAVIAGTWGAICGAVAGLVCAVITSVRERRPGASRSYYAWTATIVTAVLAAPVGASNLLGEADVPAWDVYVWVVAPVAVTGYAAHLLGGWVWGRTHRPDLEPA